jgi:hypothetical protein
LILKFWNFRETISSSLKSLKLILQQVEQNWTYCMKNNMQRQNKFHDYLSNLKSKWCSLSVEDGQKSRDQAPEIQSDAAVVSSIWSFVERCLDHSPLLGFGGQLCESKLDSVDHRDVEDSWVVVIDVEKTQNWTVWYQKIAETWQVLTAPLYATERNFAFVFFNSELTHKIFFFVFFSIITYWGNIPNPRTASAQCRDNPVQLTRFWTVHMVYRPFCGQFIYKFIISPKFDQSLTKYPPGTDQVMSLTPPDNHSIGTSSYNINILRTLPQIFTLYPMTPDYSQLNQMLPSNNIP